MSLACVSTIFGDMRPHTDRLMLQNQSHNSVRSIGAFRGAPWWPDRRLRL